MSFRRLGALVCASLILAVVCHIPASAEAQSADGVPACDPDNGGLILPDGFCALVVADGLDGARHLDVTADGDIYVHLRGARGRAPDSPGGGVVALRDADGDGRAEGVARFSDHYGTGLQLRGDYLYLSTTTEVYRYRMTPGELVPRGEPELVVSGFPEQRGHAAKAFAFDESDNLYVNVGAPSNVCMENRRPGSPGQEPCPQRVRQASVWRFAADSIGQTQEGDGYQFVKGTRNIVAIAWDPVTRAVYAAQHGRDAVNTLWPDRYNEDANAELPSEELFRLTDGADFGWPFCYHDRFQGTKVLAPEYGGDGREVGRCADVGQPLVAFPAHWAPNDLLFYDGEQYPARFRAGVFAVFHGSWNRAPLEQAGYQGRVRSPGGRGVYGPLRDVRRRLRGHLPLAVSSGRGPASGWDRPRTRRLALRHGRCRWEGVEDCVFGDVGSGCCRPSVLSSIYLSIRPAPHPVWRRCSSLEYSRYAHTSRLTTRAQHRPRCTRISNSGH